MVGQWDLQHEHTAPRHIILYPDAPLVGLCDQLAEGEAESRSRAGVVPLPFEADEFTEYLLPQVQGNSLPLVPNFQAHAFLLGAGLDGELAVRDPEPQHGARGEAELGERARVDERDGLGVLARPGSGGATGLATAR